MKRFKDILSRIFSPAVLLWFYPVVLVIPNVALDITEQTAVAVKIVNLLLPLGLYITVMGVWRNTGRTALLLFPVLFYGAFQVVLLYLYGESIIAVDMFLNLVTTNVREATELLDNLLGAVLTVCVVYVPTLVWSVWLVCTERKATPGQIGAARIAGGAVTLAGVLALVACYVTQPGFSAVREIFPANVIHNTVIAAKRTAATARYHETSAGFSYHASSTRPADMREVYVLVIGETSRADNWQLMGYGRNTTPRLVARGDVTGYPKALSESNTTHKSVPLMLTYLSADNFGDSINYTKSIVSAFSEAGYGTAFLSNQARNRSYIEFFSGEADKTVFLTDSVHDHYDMELMTPLDAFIDSARTPKLFIVLHTYGSHFNYADRYPSGFGPFGDGGSLDADAANRPALIDAYDNTVAYTDRVLDAVITRLDSLDCPAALLYASDHGEDIFDDDRKRFLHASPVPTYWQIHVPLVLWMSDSLAAMNPAMKENAVARRDSRVSSSESMFHTMLQLAGISTPYLDDTKSLVDSAYRVPAPRYLNDHNEGVALDSAGLREPDRRMLSRIIKQYR